MKNSLLPLALLGAVAVLFGCDEAVVSPDAAAPPSAVIETGEARPSPSAVEAPFETFAATRLRSGVSPVFTFENPGGPAVGQSQLIWLGRSAGFRVETTLEPGTAATLWVVVFNKPARCSPLEPGGEPSCGEDDLYQADVLPDVLYVAGTVADASGRATFTGRRAVGDSSRSLWALLGFASPGLLSRGAELHTIVRTHGPLIEELYDEMVGTFNGGCTPEDLPADPRLGTPGPNTCADIQFGVHLPGARSSL